MATIIDLGNGRFIAGDPAESLGADEHWCAWCDRGLEYDIDDELVVCGNCAGSAVVKCDDPECADHSAQPGTLDPAHTT